MSIVRVILSLKAYLDRPIRHCDVKNVYMDSPPDFIPKEVKVCKLKMIHSEVSRKIELSDLH